MVQETPEEIPTHWEMALRLMDARRRLQRVAHRTPVASSRTLDERVGTRLFLKCENFQRMGAFKFRGAYNAISHLSDEEKKRGVIAYSSGNHAQAVALVSRILGIRSTIVMPSFAPAPKLAATRGYGAEVVFYDLAGETREGMAARIAGERGLTVIPPFNHPDIVAGQGTAAAEFLEDAGPIDVLLVPLGGGGLLSGSALAVRHEGRPCRVIGVEPEGGDDGARSFRSGRIERVEHPDTIADGARTPSLGPLTFALIRRYVDDVITVSDADLVHTMRFVWERMKLIVEPTGVLGLAAVFTGRISFPGKRVGAILSGGNLDLAAAADLFRKFPAE